MSASPDFIAYIVDLISPLGHVSTGRMFGGVILRVDGQQLGIIINNIFYFRISKALEQKYRDHGSVPFQYDKKDSTVIVKAYFSMPDICIDNNEEFLNWARESLQITHT